MTDENKTIRDSLKAVESIIVSALAHQPDDDAKCREHMLKAKEKAELELRNIPDGGMHAT